MTENGPSQSVFKSSNNLWSSIQGGRTTIVLGAVLLMSLGAAEWLTWSRSGHERISARGAALIEQVSQNRLTNYYKGEAFARLYLIESEKGPSGFSVFYMEPVMETGSQVSYRFCEYYMMADIGRQVEIDSVVQDDLRIWSSTETRIESGIKLKETLSYKDGFLTASSNYSPRYVIPLASQVNPMNLVPPPLFDLFTRVVLEAPPAEGTGFVLPIMEPAGLKNGRVSLMPFQIYNPPEGESFPVELKAFNGDPAIADIHWTGADGTMSRKQIRIVDDRYQMLWNQDLFLGLETSSVIGRSDLASQLPPATLLIQRWLARKEIDSELFWNIVER